MTVFFGILVFTLLRGFFSGMEVAFLTANRISVSIERNKKSLRGRIVDSFYNNPNEIISVILVGKNITIVILIFLLSSVLDGLFVQFQPGFFIILFIKTLIIAAFVLIFAEFFPKVFFKAFADEAVIRLSWIMQFLRKLLIVPTWFFTAISSFLLKIVFRTKASADIMHISKIDLEQYIEDNITDEFDIETKMIRKALKLDQIKARDVMVPRPEIVSIDKNATKQEIIDLIEESKHSRIVVIDDDIEDIIGYMHHRQLINEQFKYAGDHVLPLLFVPEAMNVKDLLLKMISEKQSMVIVVDEYGGISGLITLEDLTEEIFGEIEDEYDIDDPDHFEKQLGNNEYVLAGRIEIDYINEKYEGLELPQGDYNTISGMIVNHLGDIPEKGEEVSIENFTFRIVKVSRNKIELVKMKKQE
jgi:CBS domain containing-hemolysin-like protein